MEAKDKKPEDMSFEEYRDKVHSSDSAQSREVAPTPKSGVALVFSFVMPLIYIAVGVLLIIGILLPQTYTWMRLVIGILLVLYGIFRFYRIYVGSDYYNNKYNR